MKILEYEITGNYGSQIIPYKLKKKVLKTFTVEVQGDFRLRFIVTDAMTQRRLFVINRISHVTTGTYTYTVRPPQDAILTYGMKGNGTAIVRIPLDDEEEA